MSESLFTVFGATGFIGRHLVQNLKTGGYEVKCPPRGAAGDESGHLGHVVYCVGLTGDFRTRLVDTVEAHVGLLSRLLSVANFDSWLYLSSTRVYGISAQSEVATEDRTLEVLPGADSVYDLSKLLGEAVCLAHPNPSVRAVRLSNVYGPSQSETTFLGSVLRELIDTGGVTIGEAPDSAKDYVAVEDVVGVLERIALAGRHRLYNLASGEATDHRTLAEMLSAFTGGQVSFREGGAVRRFPAIDTSRVADDLGFSPRPFRQGLEALVRHLRP